MSAKINSWNGVVVPRGTPKAVVTRLHAEINAVMRQGDMLQRLAAQGFDPEPGTPQEFSAHIRTELARYGKIIKAAGITLD